MYPKLLEVLGDEPSSEGYYTDQATGALRERAARWRSIFATRPRDEWIARLREVGIAAEPVLGPGEALADPHVAEVGLAAPAVRAGTRRRRAGHAGRRSSRCRRPDRAGARRHAGEPGRRVRRRSASSAGCGSSTSRRSSPARSRPRSWPTSVPR